MIYDPADLIPECVKEMANNDLRESYDLSPATTLSPEYDAPFSTDSRTDHRSPLYWLDAGNAQITGQALLGTVRKKFPQPESEQPESERCQIGSNQKVITEYVVLGVEG